MERKFRRCLCTSPVKREIMHFHVVVVQWRQEMYKKRDARAKLLFWLLNLSLFWHPRCRRRRRILRSLLSFSVGPGCAFKKKEEEKSFPSLVHRWARFARRCFLLFHPIYCLFSPLRLRSLVRGWETAFYQITCQQFIGIVKRFIYDRIREDILE